MNKTQSNTKVKGVILAAGYGTRFLPASKTLPKELFPLINKPVIDFIITEMIDAGIEDILIITSRRKKVLEDYFDREIELETVLAGKKEQLAKIAPVNANIHFVRQKEMKGTGDALALCESFVGDSPFVVAYPDDLVFAEVPLAQQLIDVYNDTGKSVLAVQNMPGEDVSRYGVISPGAQVADNTYKVKSVVEKPAVGTEPSNMVSLGRYLFTPEIFPVIRSLQKKHRVGEFYQTEIINELAENNRVMALDFEGKRYDTGEPLGYLKTIIDYALDDQSINKNLLAYLEELVLEKKSQLCEKRIDELKQGVIKNTSIKMEEEKQTV